jgi:AraC-like DNA-binding protein
MYISLMDNCHFFMSVFHITKGIVPAIITMFLISATGFGQLTPAEKKSNHSSPALFSVSKMPGMDTSTIPAKRSIALPIADSLSIKTADNTTRALPQATADTVNVVASPNTTNAAVSGSQKELRARLITAKNERDIFKKPSIEKKIKTIDPFPKQFNLRKGLKVVFQKQYIGLSILFLLVIMIVLFIRHIMTRADRPAFVTTTRLSVMDKEVQTACRYIEKNYRNTELSLDLICEELITGKAFLNALFCQELGLCVEEFITQVRINRARIFLDKPIDADAETTAQQSGFMEANAFRDAFKKIVGVSFEDYQKKRTKNTETK